jgi:hypothetical protein
MGRGKNEWMGGRNREWRRKNNEEDEIERGKRERKGKEKIRFVHFIALSILEFLLKFMQWI